MSDKQSRAFSLMDCTLRDGGFQTNWEFSDAMTAQYFNVCQAAQVDLVELGYLNLEPTWQGAGTGSYKALPDSLTEHQQRLMAANPGLKTVVMIDAWRILDHAPRDMAEIILAAINRAPFEINILRIAAMSSQVPASLALAEQLEHHGVSVMIHIMQIAELSLAQLRSDIESLRHAPLAAIYFGDSFGRMLPEDVYQLFQQVGEWVDLPLGFHAHDNYGLAVANTCAALRGGARYLDGTFAGIGRGAGNAPTETLGLLKPGQHEVAQCEGFLAEHIEPLKQTSHWGYSPTYRCQAKHNVHPTYAQRLFESDSLTGIDRIAVIGKIAGHDNPQKFDANILNLYM